MWAQSSVSEPASLAMTRRPLPQRSTTRRQPPSAQGAVFTARTTSHTMPSAVPSAAYTTSAATTSSVMSPNTTARNANTTASRGSVSRAGAGAGAGSSHDLASWPAYMRLQRGMVRLGYNDWADVREEDLLAGRLFPLAALLRHALGATTFATEHLLAAHDWFVIEADDRRLLAAVLRLLREAFAYRPALTQEQLLVGGRPMARHKITLVADAVALLCRLDAELQRAAAAPRPLTSHSHAAAIADRDATMLLTYIQDSSTNESSAAVPAIVEAAVLALTAAQSSRRTGGPLVPVVANTANSDPNHPVCCRHVLHEAIHRDPAAEASTARRAALQARHRALNRVPREAPPSN